MAVRYNAQKVRLARNWLAENAPYERDIVSRLGQREVCEDVARYYPGGWPAFEETFTKTN